MLWELGLVQRIPCNCKHYSWARATVKQFKAKTNKKQLCCFNWFLSLSFIFPENFVKVAVIMGNGWSRVQAPGYHLLFDPFLVDMTDSVQHSSFPSVNYLGVTQDMLMERRKKEKGGIGWKKRDIGEATKFLTSEMIWNSQQSTSWSLGVHVENSLIALTLIKDPQCVIIEYLSECPAQDVEKKQT